MAGLLSMTPTCMYLYEQLVFLFRYHQCEECEEKGKAMQYVALPLCRSMEAMLSHIKYCRAGMSCQISVCRESRIIVSHRIACKKNDCPVVLNLSTRRTAWTQKLWQQICSCSVKPVIHGLEVGNARRYLFELFHMETSTILSNKPKATNSVSQDLTTLPLLVHCRFCEDFAGCLCPCCEPWRLLVLHCLSVGGNACMVCQPLQVFLQQLCQNNHIFTVESDNFVRIGPNMEGLLPERALNHSATGIQVPSVRTWNSPKLNWKQKSRKSWRSWKRCEGLWIKRHPRRSLMCKSRATMQQL